MELDPFKVVKRTAETFERARRIGEDFVSVFFSPHRATENAEAAKNDLEHRHHYQWIDGWANTLSGPNSQPRPKKVTKLDLIDNLIEIEDNTQVPQWTGILDIHIEPTIIDLREPAASDVPVDIDLTAEEAKTHEPRMQ